MTNEGRITYLSRVHFELPDDFDSYVIGILAGVVFCSVYVAECTIAHLFEQRISLQARVSRKFAFGSALLGDNLLQYAGVDRFGLLFLLMAVSCCTSSSITRLSSNVTIVNGGN